MSATVDDDIEAMSIEQIEAELIRVSAELEEHKADAKATKDRRDRLIVVGLSKGIYGPVLAKAAGFKRHGRVYQIAEEHPGVPRRRRAAHAETDGGQA